VETENKIGRSKGGYRNQVKKKTQTPTMKWVFFLFRRITELEIEIERKRIKKVLNLGEEVNCSIMYSLSFSNKYPLILLANLF